MTTALVLHRKKARSGFPSRRRTVARFAVASIFAVLSGAASAEPVTIDLPGKVEHSTVAYDCSDAVARSVDYINAGDNSLARVEVEQGSPLLFANVLSGSGARYAAGPYIWWTKGAGATLYNETKGDAPVATCTEKAG